MLCPGRFILVESVFALGSWFLYIHLLSTIYNSKFLTFLLKLCDLAIMPTALFLSCERSNLDVIHLIISDFEDNHT